MPQPESPVRAASGASPQRPCPLRRTSAVRIVTPFRPLESKLHRPRPGPRVVSRRRIVDGLLDSPRLVTVACAPAGAGKTTLLSEWASAGRRPVAWLRLDEYDNDPTTLLTYIALALGRIAAVGPGVHDALKSPVPPLREYVVPTLAAALDQADPFLFVLDDAHLLTDAAGWDAVAALVSQLPQGATLALGTRCEPPLPLARLRAQDDLAEVGFHSLAFDEEEIARLLALHGVSADDMAVSRLLEATEGWAAGAFLAVSAGARAARGSPSLEIRGDRLAVSRYLRSEVLEGQPPALQRFLLRTSILDHLSPALCQAVTGRRDAGTLLRDLAARGTFLARLDDSEARYRYNRLFAEFLRAELDRRSPGDVAQLHRRAAVWHREEGDVGRAVQHFLAAGDVRAAGDLVAASWPPYILHGHHVAVGSWLNHFSEEQILSHPPLTLAVGWYHGICGDTRSGLLWHRAATLTEVDGPSPDGAASLAASRAMLRGVFGWGGVSQMRRDAELAMSLETRRGSSWHAMACLLLGLGRLADGELEAAIEPFTTAAEEGSVFNVVAEMGSLGYLSLIAADLGRWDEAAAFVERTRERVAALHLGDVAPSAHIHVARARVLSEERSPDVWLEVDRAEYVLARMVPWPFTTLCAAVLLGEICLREGRVDVAAEWLARADATLERWPDAGALRDRALALREAVRQRRGLVAPTAAEEKVLCLLPTQLSVPQIAARLCVSKETVRTHAKHIHFKLGANSRTEAVERAREAGLLPL